MADKIELGWSRLPGQLLKRWPKGADGEPEPAVFLVHCKSTDMEDELTLNLLDAYGIPALRVYPGDGPFGKVVLGMSGTGSDILVPETMYEDAKALMEAEPDDELQS